VRGFTERRAALVDEIHIAGNHQRAAEECSTVRRLSSLPDVNGGRRAPRSSRHWHDGWHDLAGWSWRKTGRIAILVARRRRGHRPPALWRPRCAIPDAARLAVIPERADDALATRAGRVAILQHGWAHRSHAPDDGLGRARQ
jgi:hypothetical protein